MNYKTISVILHKNDSILEFDFKKNLINNEDNFIIKMPHLLELIKQCKCSIVLFTNTNIFFDIDKICHEFISFYIFNAMRQDGVKQIFFETSEPDDEIQYSINDYAAIIISDKNEILI